MIFIIISVDSSAFNGLLQDGYLQCLHFVSFLMVPSGTSSKSHCGIWLHCCRHRSWGRLAIDISNSSHQNYFSPTPDYPLTQFNHRTTSCELGRIRSLSPHTRSWLRSNRKYHWKGSPIQRPSHERPDTTLGFLCEISHRRRYYSEIQPPDLENQRREILCWKKSSWGGNAAWGILPQSRNVRGMQHSQCPCKCSS